MRRAHQGAVVADAWLSRRKAFALLGSGRLRAVNLCPTSGAEERRVLGQVQKVTPRRFRDLQTSKTRTKGARDDDRDDNKQATKDDMQDSRKTSTQSRASSVPFLTGRRRDLPLWPLGRCQDPPIPNGRQPSRLRTPRYSVRRIDGAASPEGLGAPCCQPSRRTDRAQLSRGQNIPGIG